MRLRSLSMLALLALAGAGDALHCSTTIECAWSTWTRRVA
jgi:hypothetical protein